MERYKINRNKIQLRLAQIKNDKTEHMLDNALHEKRERELHRRQSQMIEYDEYVYWVIQQRLVRFSFDIELYCLIELGI